MSLKKVQLVSNILDKMTKPDMVQLAKKYNNNLDKIKNIYKLKKQDLKVELLARAEKVYKILNAPDKKPEDKPEKKTEMKKQIKKNKMSKEDQDKLLNKSISLAEQAMEAKDPALKKKLLMEIEKIDKKIKKGL